MTIEIPAWILWTAGLGLGVPLVLIILALAWAGFMLLWAFSAPRW